MKAQKTKGDTRVRMDGAKTSPAWGGAEGDGEGQVKSPTASKSPRRCHGVREACAIKRQGAGM
jgi:hypothetical protein